MQRVTVRMTHNRSVVDWNPIKRQQDPGVSLSKKLYPHCLVLIGSRSCFVHDFTIELNQLWTIYLNVK